MMRYEIEEDFFFENVIQVRTSHFYHTYLGMVGLSPSSLAFLAATIPLSFGHGGCNYLNKQQDKSNSNKLLLQLFTTVESTHKVSRNKFYNQSNSYYSYLATEKEEQYHSKRVDVHCFVVSRMPKDFRGFFRRYS